ncbi:helix-turn-helix transcriptional regulator [Mucilaginibacter sp. KACC 22773]|uniref:helix-turn-helix domain-containing protein n=1 Tax=Mucilaginibacter sp. KACC 22773 TaxID=3025671 RepID=UPI002365F6E8|nr:helix-turn-helix transcriptional regulator [Mucilaginibacter sp. KACC 22773]WDF81296.1 helix-turn-helix transcriptional regulator [Mucilaginibacter sp. KACC 22773]
MNHFDKISCFSNAIGIKAPEHPLFSISFGNKDECAGDDIEFSANFYIISFQQLESGNITHGRTKFDHDRGKLLFIKPRQPVTFKNIKLRDECFLILIHEDFLAGTPLHHQIKKYGYFDYETNEALYLSPSEEEMIWNLVNIMDKEYRNNTDDFTKTILLSHLDTLLKYAHRFYKRQFTNRADITGTVATKFHALLHSYFETKKTQESGLPTVTFMAERLNFSSRYLSDMLKQETGKTALELIHLYLITEAKNLLKEGVMNIAEISFLLGFENPTYFSRLFKKEVGVPPNVFRDRHLN